MSATEWGGDAGLIAQVVGLQGGPVIQLAVALGLLMLGRRLYWLFVAAVGFVVALELTSAYLLDFDPWVRLVLAVIAGILGALFAILLQRLAVAVAGFVVSAYFASEVLTRFALDDGIELVAVLVVGILGAIFASVLFDWALILLSSLAGAAMLVDIFALDQPLALIMLVVLAIAGISIQANILHRDKQKG